MLEATIGIICLAASTIIYFGWKIADQIQYEWYTRYRKVSGSR